MVIAVRTERRSDGLEIVKQADTDADRRRLQHEAVMLRRAAHPGVVEIVAESPTSLRLRHAGTALARLGPLAPDHTAAVVRSVAATVGDLHQLGLVHGRIRADHVVLDARGRPRLCGFADAADATDDRRAADVAALGALLAELLDAAGEVLWSPEHRGLRAATRRKRALAGFRAAAAAAQHAEPHRRPTARQLSAALLDALPELHLPVTPGDDEATERPRTFSEIPADVDPTADLGWTDDDLFFLADIDEGHDLAGSGDDDHDPTEDPVDADALDAHLDHDDHDPVVHDDPGPGVHDGPAPVPTDPPPPSPPPPNPPPPAGTVAPAARQDGVPTITIRPATPAATSPRSSGPDRRLLAALAAVVLVVGVVAGSAIARAVRPFGADAPATAATAGDAPATTTSTTTPVLVTPPTFPPQCEVPDAPGPDVDDDGCPDAVVLDGRAAQVGSVRVELGEDGDLVALGDPDCDGMVTPALLRPRTGEVFVFAEWSLSEPVEVPASAVVEGADAIASPPPCTPFVVEVDGTDVEIPR